jgi:hypothetical protein
MRHLLLASPFFMCGCSSPIKEEQRQSYWYLYREGAMNTGLEIYVAAFNADAVTDESENSRHNRENCEHARDHFNQSPLILAEQLEYWCGQNKAKGTLDAH